nr:MAG TPA: hypothetical protein [Caudoviricetes sp.]
MEILYSLNCKRFNFYALQYQDTFIYLDYLGVFYILHVNP